MLQWFNAVHLIEAAYPVAVDMDAVLLNAIRNISCHVSQLTVTGSTAARHSFLD